MESLEEIVAEGSAKWFPNVDPEGVVYLAKEADEIVVDDESVVGGKVKIIDYPSERELPDHKVKVKLVEKRTGHSPEYKYVASVTDETVQQATEEIKKDGARRIAESDPLSGSRSSFMSDMNARPM